MSLSSKIKKVRGTYVEPAKPVYDYKPVVKPDKNIDPSFKNTKSFGRIHTPTIKSLAPKEVEKDLFVGVNKITRDKGTPSIKESTQRQNAKDNIVEAKVEKETKLANKVKAKRLETELSDKYGIDVKRANSPIEAVNMLSMVDDSQKEQFKKDFAEYSFAAERSNPFRAAAESGFNVLPTNLEKTEGKEEVQNAKDYGFGRLVGGIGQQLAFGSVLAAPIEGLVGKILPKATPFITETIKDVAIGTGTQLAEAPFDKPTAGQFAGNVALDIALNALFGVVGKGLSKLDLSNLKTAKPSQVVDDVAQKLNVSIVEADKVVDDAIDFYVNQSGVADTKPFEQLQLPPPSRLSEKVKAANVEPQFRTERPNVITQSDLPTRQIEPTLRPTEQLEPTLNVASKVDQPTTTMKIEPTLKPKKVEVKQPSDAKMKFRKTITNSFQKSQLDDTAKVYFDANPREYEVYTNQESWNKAFDKVDSNFTKSIDDFQKKSAIENADDTAEGIAIMHKLSNDDNIDELIKVADTFSERATSAGQAVQAIVMLQKTTPEGKLVQSINIVKNAKKQIETDMPDLYNKLKKDGKLPEITKDDAQFIVDQMKKAQELTGRAKEIEIGKVDQLLANKIPATFGDKVRAIRNLSLLGNIKTIVTRNPLGNLIFAGLENLSQIPSGLTDKIVSNALKTTRTTKVLPSIGTQVKGFKKGFSEALSDIKLGIDTSPVRGGAELPRSKKVFEIALLNKANNWLGNALKLGDRPFYQAAYDLRLKELQELMPDADPKDLELLSKEFGLSRTFQNDGSTSKAFKKVKDAFNTGNIKGFGFGDVVMPYTQTPANILAKGVQYTPLNIIQIAKIASGGTENIAKNQKAFVDAVGRTFTGSGIIALGYTLAKNGYISGKNQDTSSKAKALKKDIGQQQYSIKIGDTWYSYDWAQPASIPLAVGVDFFNAGASEKDILTAIEKGSISGGETLLQQGLLQGVMRMFGGYSPIENVIETIGTSPTQFLPTLGNQTAQMKDEYKRDVNYKGSVGNQLLDLSKRRIPGVRETLPATLNMWGEPVKEQQGRTGLEKAFDVFVNPSLKSKESDDPILQEVNKVFKETKDTSVIPSYTPSALTSSDETRNFKMIYGPMAKRELETLFRSSTYKGSREQNKLIKKVLDKLQDKAKDAYNLKYKTDLR